MAFGAMGRASSSKSLLAPIILLICTGWIRNSVVHCAPVIDRDTQNNMIRADNNHNNNGTDVRDKIETELGPAPLHEGAQGRPPILIIPEYFQTDNGNNDQNQDEIERAPVQIEYEAGLVLRCAAKGYPHPNLTWELDQGHLPHYVEQTGLKYSHPQANGELDINKENKGIDWVDLRLPKLNNAFYGKLRCKAMNEFGNSTWEIVLVHNANSSVLMKLVRVTLSVVFVLVAILLFRFTIWINNRQLEKLYEKLPPQDLEIINRFKKGIAPPPPSPSSSICQTNAIGGLGASCVGGIEITVTGDSNDAAALNQGYHLVKEQLSTPDLQKKLIGGGSSNGGSATPTSCCSVHVVDFVNSWANYVPYDDKLELSSQHFKVDFSTILENGSYGMVYAGKVRNDLTMEWSKVAVKSGRTERDDNFLLESILTELKILASLPKAHANIVNLKGAYTKLLHKRQAHIFLDYCEYGQLANFIDLNRQNFQIPGSAQDLSLPSSSVPSNNNSVTVLNSEINDKGLVMTVKASTTTTEEVALSLIGQSGRYSQSFGLKQLLTWAWQISDGMNFLHKNRIIHGNLSTASVYLTSDLSAKIGNVGCPPPEESSGCIDEITRKFLTVPTFGYEHFSKKSDVWEFGRVLWEIFSLREQRFPDRSTITEFLRNDGEEDEDDYGELEVPDYATPELFELMLCCWNEDGTLSPEFDFLSRAIKQIVKNLFQAPVQTMEEVSKNELK